MKNLLTRAGSSLWSTANAAMRAAARAGLRRPARLPARVISVGNLQVGGAGKTPLVGLIAREAHARGQRVCILCRGYRSEWESTGGVLSPGGPAPETRRCGDEAALLRELAPQAVIGVGADRVAQFRRVEKIHGGFDLVILDDGFQNTRIAKDVEIVAVTAKSRGEILFRDRNSALKSADLMVWTKGEVPPDAGGQPWVQVRFQLPAPTTRGEKVWFVTGLADGKFARESAIHAGYAVEHSVFFADHARYDRTEVQRLLTESKAAGCRLAITGKDWVKWRELGVERASLVVLEPDLIFERGADLWQRVLWGDG